MNIPKCIIIRSKNGEYVNDWGNRTREKWNNTMAGFEKLWVKIPDWSPVISPPLVRGFPTYEKFSWQIVFPYAWLWISSDRPQRVISLLIDSQSRGEDVVGVEWVEDRGWIECKEATRRRSQQIDTHRWTWCQLSKWRVIRMAYFGYCLKETEFRCGRDYARK